MHLLGTTLPMILLLLLLLLLLFLSTTTTTTTTTYCYYNDHYTYTYSCKCRTARIYCRTSMISVIMHASILGKRKLFAPRFRNRRKMSTTEKRTVFSKQESTVKSRRIMRERVQEHEYVGKTPPSGGVNEISKTDKSPHTEVKRCMDMILNPNK